MSGKAVPTSSPLPASPRSQPRNTVTFTPYFWEAYNEIVEPRRFDNYLITKWLPDLGPLGFTILKTLRNRCYFHPGTGTVRNEIDVKMKELAAAVRVDRATLFRELDRNTALAQFIQRQAMFDTVGGRPQQVASRFTVCMDDPIHPDDMERYEELRAEKEMQRPYPPTPVSPGKRVRRPPDKAAEKPASQIATLDQSTAKKAKLPASQIATLGAELEYPGSQNATPYPKGIGLQNATPDATHLPAQTATAIVYSPSGGLYTDSLTPPGAAAPPINSPQGEAEAESASKSLRAWEAVHSLWETALSAIEAQVNKPTFEGHMRSLRPIGFEGGDETETFVLLVRSAFNREWVEKRHSQTIATAVSDACGRNVAVRFTLVAPGEEKGRP